MIFVFNNPNNPNPALTIGPLRIFPEFFVFCFLFFVFFVFCFLFFPPNLLHSYCWGRIWVIWVIDIIIPFLFLFLVLIIYNLEENIIEVIIGYIRYIKLI